MAKLAALRSAIADLAAARLTFKILLFMALVALFLSILGYKSNLSFPVYFDPDPMAPDCNLLSKRGIRLLHTLSDEEILDLAAKSGANGSNLLRFPRYRACRSVSGALKPKIAFLFLTKGSLPLGRFWEEFFKGKEDLYNIYVHSDPFFLDAPFDPRSPFWGRLIPSKTTAYNTPLLIAAMRRLLANAILDDSHNQFFAFVSESCIPIHGFDKVYRTISSSKRTFMELFDHSGSMEARYNARGDGVMLPEIKFEDFRVGSQFSVIKRKHAIMYVKDKKFWAKFNRQCLHLNCFPDEHYFPTIMNLLDPSGATGFILTFVDWSKAQGPHPRLFTKEEVNKDLIQDLQQRDGGRYMFARKFPPDCLDHLLNLKHFILD